MRRCDGLPHAEKQNEVDDGGPPACNQFTGEGTITPSTRSRTSRSIPLLIFDPGALPEDALLTTKEVAAWTRFSVVAFEKWRANGRGPRATVVENRIRYRVGSVREWLRLVKEIEQPAVSWLLTLNADDRQQVRTYYTALWLWNRLDKTRWSSAKLALRQHSRKRNSIEVDHIVAWDLWRTKLSALPPNAEGADADALSPADELMPKINDLGNCMLLEKNFNISKSSATLRSFLDGVYEFQEKKLVLNDWAAALDLDMAQVDSGATAVEALQTLFSARAQKIRGDLEQFIRGTKDRVDLDVS